MKIILIFLGGGLGAALRWLVGEGLKNPSAFPTSTFVVNMLGCLLIGIVALHLLQGNDSLYLFAVIGLLGGFTTFSSYGLELFKMLQNGSSKQFWIYLLASNVLGVFFVYLGHTLAGYIWK